MTYSAQRAQLPTAEPAQGTRARRARPQAVAAIGYRAMMRGKRVAVAGWLNPLMAVATRVTPTAILMRIARSLHQR